MAMPDAVKALVRYRDGQRMVDLPDEELARDVIHGRAAVLAFYGADGSLVFPGAQVYQ